MGNTNKNKKKENNKDNDDDIVYLPHGIYIYPLTKYQYFERRVPYSTEELNIQKKKKN